MKWIVPAILIALGSAGGLAAWAAPSEGENDDQDMVANPSEVDSARVGRPVLVPTSRTIRRIAMDGELIGTVVVEKGTSYAIFQSGKGTTLVREGDEIASGMRLVQVRRNRIDVERNGIREEIRLGWSEGSQQQVGSGSAHIASGLEVRARLREDLRARGRL